MSLDRSYCEPVYLISEVATILDIHPQTLRQYEREGLISPSRTVGKIRQYSQKDIDKIKSILVLTRVHGVNLAGVSMILELEKKISDLEDILSKDGENKKNTPSTTKALVVKKMQFDIVIFK